MERKTKNIIMILLLLLLAFISFLVMFDHKQPKIIFNNIEDYDNNMPNVQEESNNKNQETTNTETTQNDKSEMNNIKQRDNFIKMNQMHEFNMNNHNMNKHSSINLYLFIGLFISMIIMYLVMSKFNKLSMKETFTGIDNIIIFILSTFIITISLTLTQSILTKNKLNHNNIQPPNIVETKNTD